MLYGFDGAVAGAKKSMLFWTMKRPRLHLLKFQSQGTFETRSQGRFTYSFVGLGYRGPLSKIKFSAVRIFTTDEEVDFSENTG